MPQPYPGQQWEHGWKPLTPGALKDKNHGRLPKGGNRDVISRLVKEAAAVHKRNQENRQADTKPKPETAKPAAKKPAAKAIAKPAAKPAPKPTPKPTAKAPAKPKLGKKAGEDSRNAPLREGDKVTIIEGKDRGKTGTVTGKGKYGAVKVVVDGQESDRSPANIRSTEAAAASRKADDAIRTAAGRGRPAAPEAPKQPARPDSAPVSDAAVASSVADFLKGLPEGKWATMTALRKQLKGVPRNQQDDVIRQMMLDGKVDIEPIAIYGDLKAEDRAAEIMIGSTRAHQIRRSR
ncbi:KOW motif domain-containing protein [Acrocarpospora sp. B8E8]|uniref:KOW motif domain-containing protein n=1 Tax=Acrocarpospora sp. B8E8 TaxID=3153572 RepID=UPI00325EC97C